MLPSPALEGELNGKPFECVLKLNLLFGTVVAEFCC